MRSAINFHKSFIGMPGIRIEIQSGIIELGNNLKPEGKGFRPIMDGNMRNGEVELIEQETFNCSGRHIGIVI